MVHLDPVLVTYVGHRSYDVVPVFRGGLSQSTCTRRRKLDLSFRLREERRSLYTDCSAPLESFIYWRYTIYIIITVIINLLGYKDQGRSWPMGPGSETRLRPLIRTVWLKYFDWSVAEQCPVAIILSCRLVNYRLMTANLMSHPGDVTVVDRRHIYTVSRWVVRCIASLTQCSPRSRGVADRWRGCRPAPIHHIYAVSLLIRPTAAPARVRRAVPLRPYQTDHVPI